MTSTTNLKKVLLYLYEIYPEKAGYNQLRKEAVIVNLTNTLNWLKNWFLIDAIKIDDMKYYKLNTELYEKLKMRENNGEMSVL